MKLALLIVVLIGAARADILRLRDGRMFTGNFLGATRTEIWFQRDAPGDFIGTAAYPVEQVESLTFGPVAKQSGASASDSPEGRHGTLRVSPPDVRANIPSREAPR